MRKVTVRIGGLIAAASAALMLAGVSPALASPAAVSKATGPELISGAAYGKAALANITPIPLTFSGVVATTDRGFTLGPGGGKTHTLATAAGKLTLTETSKPANTQTMNHQTCRFTYTSRAEIKFVPGQSTGKFAGASGPGAYQVYFAAYAPRYASGKHKGQCNLTAQPLAKGAVGTFLAAGVLTVG